jgi:hypothetical protein
MLCILGDGISYLISAELGNSAQLFGQRWTLSLTGVISFFRVPASGGLSLRRGCS